MRDLDEVMIKSLEERRKLNREHLKQRLEESNDNNAKLIIKEAETICGNYCDFYSCHDGYVLGATCGLHDYYWLYITSDMKVSYSSCVCNPKPLEEIPSVRYKHFDDMMKETPEIILNIIKESLNKCDDIMMTPIYLGGNKYNLEV